MKSKAIDQKVITGILIPEQWDDNGNIVGVSIQAFDETEYLVEACHRGNALLEFINQKVKVAGKVFKRPDGKYFLEVKQFEVLELT